MPNQQRRDWRNYVIPIQGLRGIERHIALYIFYVIY